MSTTGRRSHDSALCWAFLVAFPILAHCPVLTGWLTIDPIYRFSGLSKSVWMQGMLPGDAFIDGNAGVTTQALGILSARDWLHGVVPWWNPYSGIGLPLAGEMQSSSFFLPFIFLLLLPAGLVLLKIAVQLVAGFATFYLLRELGVRRSAALAGAIVFEMNGTFAWIAHAPILPVAFLPLLIFGIERAAVAARTGRTGGWRWISVAIAYSVLAGFPEVAYLDGLLALAWTIWRAATLGKCCRRFSISILIGGVVGLSLAAPLMTAFADFLSVAYVGGHIGFTHRHLVTPNVAMLLFPYVAGSVGNHVFWFTIGGYVGLPAFLLALLGLLNVRHGTAPRWLLGGWLVVTFAASVGVPGITPLVDAVPLISRTMLTNYIAPSWSMAIAILCALAIDDWQRGGMRRGAILFATSIACVTGIIALYVSWAGINDVWSVDLLSRRVGLLSIGWEYAVAGCLVLLSLGQQSRRRRVVFVAVMSIDALASFSIPVLSGVVKRPPVDVTLTDFLHARLEQGRFASGGAIYANYGAMFGLASVNYNYLPNARNWVDYVIERLDPSADQVNFPGNAVALWSRLSAYEAAGVRFAVMPSGTGQGIGTRVMQTPSSDLYALPSPANYIETRGGHCRLTSTDRNNLNAQCQTDTMLIRRELYMPGWTATVNGNNAPLMPLDAVFQTVKLPAGNNIVRFDFRPPYVVWADLLMVSGLAVFVSSLVFRHRGWTGRRLEV